MSTTTRPYRGSDHLWSIVTTDAGTLAVHPMSARSLYFDAAWSNHAPAYADTGEHGSTVLDIGRGARVRVAGNAEKVGACWELTHLHCSRDSGGDVTRAMHARAEALVFEMLNEWAQSHAGDIAQADDIARNNDARRLEQLIAEHERAVAILRENLAACDEGEPYTGYPDLRALLRETTRANPRRSRTDASTAGARERS